jgi:hypothetical protein
MRAFRGQMAAEDALARQANRVLICAADAVTLAARAASSPGGCPDEIAAAADGRRCDLYLLIAARMDRPTPVIPSPRRWRPADCRSAASTAPTMRSFAGLRVRRRRVARQTAMTFA